LQWPAESVDDAAFSVISTDAIQAIAALIIEDRGSLTG